MRTILFFIKKEFIQFKRDPRMFALILIAPVIQLIFLGYAANLDVDLVNTAVYDMDKSEESRKLTEKLSSSGYFSIKYYPENYQEVTKLLDQGKVIFALIIPRNFSTEINNNRQVRLQTIMDGSDGNKASITAGYVQSIISDYSSNLISDFRDKRGLKIPTAGTVTPEIRVWYNPELKTRNFMVPAIVGLLLSIITLILTSLAIVKEKEIGTLEQLIVTPIKPYQLIVSKLVPFAGLGFAAVIIVLTAMRFIFNIPVRGSITFLFGASFLYILSTLGLGLFVSTISKTQQQAMMIAIFVVMMPMIYLSGFAFPIENMPEVIQYIAQIIPLKYFITIIRGVILKGLGFADLWYETLILFVMGAGILTLSSLRFRKRLE